MPRSQSRKRSENRASDARYRWPRLRIGGARGILSTLSRPHASRSCVFGEAGDGRTAEHRVGRHSLLDVRLRHRQLVQVREQLELSYPLGGEAGAAPFTPAEQAP